MTHAHLASHLSQHPAGLPRLLPAVDKHHHLLTALEGVGDLGGWMGGWMGGWVDGWVDGCGWMGGCGWM